MGVSCLNSKELNLDEKSPKESGKNIEELKQESERDITASELDLEFVKMRKNLPLTIDVIQGKRTSRCRPESCPFGSDLDLASFATLLNSIKNLGLHLTDSGEFKGSFSLNLLNKALCLFNFPLNLRLSDFIIEYIIYQRNTRSLNDPVSFFSENSAIDNSIGNVILSHSGWWKLDAFQDNSKAMSLFKESLFFQLSILNDVVNPPRSRSPRLMHRTLELSTLPVLVDNTPAGRKGSEVKFPKMKLISCPSSNSSFSWRSTSSANTSITKGQLQCIHKGGLTYFIFSLDDSPQVTYKACHQKIEFSTEKTIDCMYLFYFKDSKNSDSRKNSMNSTSLMAKMKVSSSIVLTPNRLKIMETEFVLYGYQEELPNKLQKSSSVVSGSKSFHRKVTEIFRQSNMGKIKPKDDIDESTLGNEAFDALLPNLELAAIVVEESFKDTANGLMFGGWGLKFLEKASRRHTCSSKNLSIKDESSRRMNVIIPADLHGGPVTEHGGPASIITRWRSGGHCDCGGWDIGCPLTVLNHSSINTSASTMETEKKPVNLFIEGTENSRHPTLSMMKMTEGLYSIYFQSSLSVLQSFSIAVAAIHKNG